MRVTFCPNVTLYFNKGIGKQNFTMLFKLSALFYICNGVCDNVTISFESKRKKTL